MKKSSSLHVAMLIDAWFPSKNTAGIFGGGQMHVQELIRHLEQQFLIKVTLFYPAKANIGFRLLWTFWVVLKLIWHNRQQPFDLIHSQGYNTGLSAKLVGWWLKRPTIHTVHGSNLIDQKMPGLKTKLERWLLTQMHYSRQISVSSSFLKHPNVNQVTVIPNGVNVADFNQVKVKKLKMPNLIWVGRQDPVKGLPVLKEAIRSLRRDFPNLHVEFVTGGRLSGQKLIKAYKAARVFVLPSLSEGQPITLLEAWAARLPVVVTNVGDNPNLVKEGNNGLLVTPGSSRQLASAIKKVLEDPAFGKALGQAGHRHVTKHHQWSIIAAQTFKVYQEVLSSKF